MQTSSAQGGAKYFSSTRVAVIALFSAISAILYILKFPISVIFPSWLELNFSDIPALIGTFALGPLSGAIIVAFKILLELMFTGTSTLFVGDFADLILGCAFVVPAGLIYKHNRTFKGALAGLVVGSLCSTAHAKLANWLVLVPFYVYFFFGNSWEPILSIMSGIFGEVTMDNFYNIYLWASVLPFNLLRCIVAVLVALPVYKHISHAINRLNCRLTPKTERTPEQVRKTNVRVLIIAAAVIVAIIAAVLLRFFLHDFVR